MASVEISDTDLECGNSHHSSSATVSDGDETDSGKESLCFSDADEGSCYSQFYSTADRSFDDYRFAEVAGVSVSRRVSSATETESDLSVDIESGIGENKVHLGRTERDCRICHLSLDFSNPESGIAIELGCSCKDDLAAAHKNCAETWFKIKGNKTCEICNSVARNVFGANEILESTQHPNNIDTTTTTTTTSSTNYSISTGESRSYLNGHRIVNSLLACMVFAFVISWLFHFNIPS